MATKKDASLETILKTVGRGFAALADDIADIKGTMATKAHLHEVEERLTARIDGVDERLIDIERELGAIRRDLDDLHEKFENVSGFRKEIDHALERIAAIEKHLGISKKIAA